MREDLRYHVKIQGEGFLNSYSQVFFSDHRGLAFLLIGVSFLDPFAGLSGALSVLISNLTAQSMGFYSFYIRKGYYGYNSLLVGLGFGLTFNPGAAFFLLIMVAALLTLLFTISIQGFLYKYNLPYLSIPFLLSIWMIMLASGEFSALGLSERGVYTFNELFSIGGKSLIDRVEWFDSLIKSQSIRTYIFSLGAIFFQYKLLAGIVIALGLLLYSRIAFTLSLFGFYMAWFFYKVIGADISMLGYSFIGFNYILTSIALGGVFIIPSRWSYLWLIWLLPLVIVVTVSLQQLFSIFRLGVYALPFNIVVITFLYVLKIREKPGHRLVETPIQHFSPEKNLYHLHVTRDRFFSDMEIPITLPVMGDWMVSQGYHGEHTHKGEWAHAIDLVMMGTDGSQYRGEGVVVRDYYCYEKPVVAPADGTVADVIDGIPDNLIGDNNIHRNWGNSVVIRHSGQLYSQMSHLKPGSVKVKPGEAVKKGDILGLCGNSGRSPYPHLHFQVQTTPHIGSKTLHYPLSNYLLNNKEERILKTHAIPLKGEIISAIQNHPLFEKAFHFLPGRKLTFEIAHSTLKRLQGSHSWEIKTDEYNNSFFECQRTGAVAYFFNNGNIHYFTNYIGTRKSLLYYFYLGFYKVMTGFYPGLTIEDTLPPDKVYPKATLFGQDFAAPFYIYLKAGYRLSYQPPEEDFYDTKASLTAIITKTRKEKMEFKIRLSRQCISEFHFSGNNIEFNALCTES